jgi:hypothetical protein
MLARSRRTAAGISAADELPKSRKVCNGRSNLAEIKVDGPAGHIEFLSLRLYNPQSHQWSLNFASSKAALWASR